MLPMFAEDAPTVGWPDRPRHLLSYAWKHMGHMDVARDRGVDLVVDSGAFTVANSGGTVDHDAYMEWLSEHRDIITFALSLDVIGDHVASRVNHEVAEDRIGDLVDMVPTYHLGSPMRELERLCKAYPLVSIGGAVPFARQARQLHKTLRQIHRTAAEHGAKLHGLGMTGNSVIHGFPWFSLDSSSWLTPVRFPSLSLADSTGRLVAMEHGWHLSQAERALVALYGGDPDLVSTPGWSLAGDRDPEVFRPLRRWVLMASARAFMFAEASKNAHQPEAPIRIYLSGVEAYSGAEALISDAHALGSPYPVHQPATA